MDNEDIKIKQFITNDKTISNRANQTFDDFIAKVQTNQIEREDIQQEQYNKQQEQFKSKERPSYFVKFKKLMTVAASLVIVVVASNVYARTQGYDNIFFMIKDWVTPKEEQQSEEIFSDRDIVVSYKSIQITDDVELQINELQIKNNKAKLYLLVKEKNGNTETPFNYKIYNDENQVMFDDKSSKKENEKTYTEVLNLENYKDSTNIIKIEIYSKDKILLKTISMDLSKKTIEARTENQVVKKISQIELNKFLKQETVKTYTEKELKDREVIILDTYDIYYNNGKYIAKYLYMIPTQKEIDDDEVENSKTYTNTIEFTSSENGFTKIKIEKEEIF